MTLRTSSHKTNAFGKMICFTLRKSIGIIIVVSIAALLYCPGSFIVKLEDMRRSIGITANGDDFLNVFAFFVTGITALFVTVLNVINLDFMYKRNASDVFYAFPLTRTQLLLSRVTAGLVTTAIPMFLCYISYGIMMLFNSWMGNFTQLLYYLLHTIVITLVCSAFSLIFIVSAGNLFDLGVSFIGANLALLFIGSIYDNILSVTLLGYSNGYLDNAMYLSPYYFCVKGAEYAESVVKNGVSAQSIKFLTASVIFTLIFTAISILLFNYRKAEKGGSAYAYKFMYLICSLLAGICGGYLIGMLFDPEPLSIGFWIFASIGSVLISVIFGLVTNRGFKGAGVSVIMGIAAAVISGSVAITGIAGGFGYAKHIPKSDEINDVYINVFNESIHFNDPSDIIDLHKAIINGNNSPMNNSLAYGDCKHLVIDYNLKNGKTVPRSYYAITSQVESELLEIYKSDERFKSIKESLPIEKALQITLYFYDGQNYYNIDITKKETDAFLAAYWQDVQSCSADVLDDTDTKTYYEISGYTKSDGSDYFHFSLENQSSFKNAQKFIEENNLKERAEENENLYD